MAACRPLQSQSGTGCPVLFLNEPMRRLGAAGEQALPLPTPNKGCEQVLPEMETLALLHRLVQGRDQNAGSVAMGERVATGTASPQFTRSRGSEDGVPDSTRAASRVGLGLRAA